MTSTLPSLYTVSLPIERVAPTHVKPYTGGYRVPLLEWQYIIKVMFQIASMYLFSGPSFSIGPVLQGTYCQYRGGGGGGQMRII